METTTNIQEKKVSPKGSFTGYDFIVYLDKNPDAYKNILATIVTLEGAMYVQFGFSWLLLIPPGCAVLGAIAHAVVSAIQFKNKEVEL